MIRLLKRKPMQPAKDVACAQCGKVFAISPSRLARSKSGLVFCSNACSAKHYSEIHSEANAQCQYCGKVFHRSPANFRKSNTFAYCSRDCYDKARKEGIAEVRKPEHTEHSQICKHCGKPFVIPHSTNNYYQRQYCTEECERLSRKTTGVFARYFETKKRGTCCEICGIEEPEILEVHHKDRNRQNNAVENLLRICPNCHRKIHRGKK